MAILSLPTELLLAIGEQECLTRDDHWSLTLVNKKFFVVFIHILFREIRIQIPQRDSIPNSRLSKFTVRGPILQRIVERLESSPHLKAWVRKYRIRHLIHRNRYYPHRGSLVWLLDPLFLFIRELIHLDLIYSSEACMPTEWILSLARWPGRSTIELSGTYIHDETLSDPSFNTTALTSYDHFLDPLTLCLTFNTALIHLCFPHVSLEALTDAHVSANSPILKLLKYLCIRELGDAGCQFFTCTPNLIQLEFVGGDGVEYIPIYSKEWDRVLPRLKHIKCRYMVLPGITRDRSVTSIWLRDVVHYPLITPKYFGSNVTVTRLCVDSCYPVSKFLSYIVAHNIKIKGLIVTHQEMDRTSCESCIPLLSNIDELNPTLSKICGMS